MDAEGECSLSRRIWQRSIAVRKPVKYSRTGQQRVQQLERFRKLCASSSSSSSSSSKHICSLRHEAWKARRLDRRVSIARSQSRSGQDCREGTSETVFKGAPWTPVISIEPSRSCLISMSKVAGGEGKPPWKLPFSFRGGIKGASCKLSDGRDATRRGRQRLEGRAQRYSTLVLVCRYNLRRRVHGDSDVLDCVVVQHLQEQHFDLIIITSAGYISETR